MAWSYRVVQLQDQLWECRWGRHVYDTHVELSAAIEHCSSIAAGNPPADVYLHRTGVHVQKLASIEMPHR